MKWIEDIRKLFFPKKCIFCRRWIDENSEVLVCKTCAANMKMASGRGRVKVKGHISFAYAPFSYERAVRRALIAFKFREKICFGDTFGAFMTEYTKINLEKENIDIIIPVPVSKKKMLSRGYNQSLVLAQAMAKRLYIPVDDRHLIKIKETKQQSRIFDYKKRIENVRDAFRFNGELNGANVLLIDDIYTTGATADSCAKALKVAGADKIYVCSAANKNLKEKMKKLPIIILGKNIRIKT